RITIFQLSLCICMFSYLSGWGQKPTTDNLNPVYYKLKRVNLPPEVRPEVRYSLSQLGFKAQGGGLPKFDGQQFQVNVFNTVIGSQDEAKRILTNMMGSLQTHLTPGKELRMTVNTTTAAANQKYIEERIQAGESSTNKKVSAKFGSESKSSADLVNETGEGLRKQSKTSVTVYRYDQYFNNVLIDNTAVTLTSRSQQQIVSVHGRFYTKVNIDNKQALTANDAMDKAITQLKTQNKYDKVVSGKPAGAMVVLPYASGFKYAWKAQVVADGPYQVWIDAETGGVLQLLPLFFFSDNAKGLVFNPDPFTGTKEMTFDVDAPVGGQYTLGKAGYMTLTNAGADGVTGIAQVTDDGSGIANFNVSPFNGTVVDVVSNTGYNGWFQQINVYAHTFNQRKYYELIGSQNFGVVNITLNQGGEDNAHPNSMFTCSGTLTGATGCGNLFNTGIDATIFTHEFGHVVNGNQFGVGGGSMTAALNEGMADFWACTILNVNMVGAWSAHNCSGPTQGGWLPRQIEALDVFPSHNSLPGASDEGHSAGQIIAWANWNSRQGMNDATDLGTLDINLNMLRAMTTAGVGITDNTTDKSVHDSYLDLLKQMAPLYSSSRLINKLLAGYARAGIFLDPKDAIIDIDHSYLDNHSATGPTFTVWTGADYTVPDSNAVTANPPYNTQYMIEVANDAAFSSNLQSSGWLNGVNAGQGGFATWMLPIAAWNALKGGTDIYYRVTTKDDNGVNIRQSWNPGNGFLSNTPVGRAAINGTGTRDCACSASAAGSSSGLALIPLLPLAALIQFRRKLKKDLNA
ncbi:MAG: hypothetical protein M3N14_07825, partial [Bacteroidota bacterium]|nr:hypothetical protein [Bacteroidota bacterium]